MIETKKIMWMIKKDLMVLWRHKPRLISLFLFPIIILFCIMGSFALNNRVFDIGILIVFGIIGYLLTRCKVPLSPIIMGFLMGPLLEKNFRRAIISASGNFTDILDRPIACVIVLAGVLFIIWPLITKVLNRKPVFSTSK